MSTAAIPRSVTVSESLRRREAAKDALTNLRLEGLTPTSDVRALVDQFVRGEFSDPYLDPPSGILRNNLGLTDQDSLHREEANAVYVRSMLLKLNPIKGNFDSVHLQQIHENLFQDVYAWAVNSEPLTCLSLTRTVTHQ